MTAKRVQITIPGELARELKPWRDRMNVSRVCAAAIENEIALLSGNLSPELGNLTETISRLRKQKAEGRSPDLNNGQEDGRSYGRDNASYYDFVLYAQAWEDFQAGRISGQELQPPAHVGDTLNDDLQRGRVTDGHAYCEGWFAGLMDVWELIKHLV